MTAEHLARVRLLARVRQSMATQTARLGKRPMAAWHLAGVRLFARVRETMTAQGARLAEHTPASGHLAYKVHHLCVRAAVPVQGARVSKRFRAARHLAYKGPRPRMRVCVIRKFPGTIEFLPTLGIQAHVYRGASSVGASVRRWVRLWRWGRRQPRRDAVLSLAFESLSAVMNVLLA